VRLDGTEDYVQIERPPDDPALRYEISLGDEIAGLRLFTGTLELLDAGGAPRLRMAPPAVEDARGRRHGATATLSGCRYDADPRPPWGRAVVAPRSRRCTVEVRWPRALPHPLLVDPAWGVAASMGSPRALPAAAVLRSGRVLVAGGWMTLQSQASAEVYDPSTDTWSPTGSMAVPRAGQTASVLADGRVLVVGGMAASLYGGPGPSISSAEIYDPSAGTWTAAGDMSQARAFHTASTLADGRVLVAGGSQDLYPTWAFLASAELFDPSAGTWSPTGSMAQGRREHTASTLASGEVLVAGGAYGDLPTTSAERYDPAGGTWRPAGSMAHARTAHTASTLGDGRVLVAGGFLEYLSMSNQYSVPWPTAEVYDPSTDTWSVTGSMLDPRGRHRAAVLANGAVLVAGGVSLASVELYDPSTGAWGSAGFMSTPRWDYAVSVLPGGDVLLAGGDFLSSAERFSLLPRGAPCTIAAQCASSACAPDGVCCDTPCQGTCQACTQAKTGVPSGTCAPALPGTDSGGACPPAGVCGFDGACGSGGACRFHAAGTACGASCVGGTLLDGHCDGAGRCASTPLSCAPYQCASASACATHCGSDADCVPTAFCDAAFDRTCQPRKVQGSSCAAADECQSGFCVDGVCCDTACAEACHSCGLGACAFAPSGKDPRGLCADEGAPTCGHDGTCDDSGACAFYGRSTVCLPSICTSAGAASFRCTGPGHTCVQTEVEDCGDFACAGGACERSCHSGADCAPSAFCASTQCRHKLTAGAICAGGEACATGLCVDGVCCNAPCQGPCEACDIAGYEGECLPVPGGGPPHGARAVCPAGEDGDVCAASSCNGVDRASCHFAGEAVTCRPRSCTAGVAVAEGFCHGLGTCPAPTAGEITPCAPFACGASACLTSCAGEADCAPGYRCASGTACGDSGTATCCVPGRCDGEHAVQIGAGEVLDCTPFRCTKDGRCLDTCSTALDCAEPFACDSSGQCVPRPGSGFTTGIGCRASSRGPDASEPWAILCLALAPLAALRNRSGRRRPAR
jgi:hypothetical protein